MEQPEKPKKNKIDEWQVKHWADVIVEAEEIKADPEKMKLVKPLLAKKASGIKKAVESLDDLRALAKAEPTEIEDDKEEGEEEEDESV